ncbi:hypothetical protein Hanom_Chr05g00458721 [Helianthus anomalus]
MSSSEGSNIYEDVDPMTCSLDDDYIPEVQVITSDSETGSDSDMDDFQPFAFLGDIVDDDVLDVPPLSNDIVIIGHPEGEHVVEIIPLDVLPLAMVPFVDLDEDNDDIVPLDDVLPDEPVVPAPGHIPTPPHSLAHLPAEEPSQAPVSEGSMDRIRLMRFVPILPHTDHIDEAGPSGHAHIPPNAQHSPPHVMPITDPYHQVHYQSISTDALILSL